MNKTYLIIEASGFIGSYLTERQINEGQKGINVDNFSDYYNLSIKVDNTLDSTGNKELRITKERGKTS